MVHRFQSRFEPPAGKTARTAGHRGRPQVWPAGVPYTSSALSTTQ